MQSSHIITKYIMHSTAIQRFSHIFSENASIYTSQPQNDRKRAVYNVQQHIFCKFSAHVPQVYNYENWKLNSH